MDQESTIRLNEVQVSELRSLTESVTLARLQFARQIGMTHAGQRDTYTVLGYPETISTAEYRDLYARGGIAGSCVDALPEAVWRGDGDVIEDQDPEVETAFEAAWWLLNDRLKVWPTLQRLHIQASLTSFSVLFLGAPGDWQTELPRATKPEDLWYITPFGGGVTNADRTTARGTTSTYGTDAVVDKWDEDISSPRFGQPLTYQLRRTNISAPELQRPVHWSRVIHVPAKGFLDDAVYGPPTLERVFNYFIDLMKVAGGGAEASWLNANPITQWDTDPEMSFSSPQDAQAHVDSMKAKAQLIRDQMQRWIETRGVKAKQLGATASDFSNNVDAVVRLIAGTLRIPKRILDGSEAGVLASDQDRNNWNDQVKDCRSSYAHPIILRPFVQRLIDYNYLPKPKQWEPHWPEVAAMSEVEKLAAAETMVKLNDHGEKVVTGAEVREFLGKEPLDDDQVGDEDEQVARLEAALRKGGTLSLAVKG